MPTPRQAYKQGRGKRDPKITPDMPPRTLQHGERGAKSGQMAPGGRWLSDVLPLGGNRKRKG